MNRRATAFVRTRAGGRCEYCGHPESAVDLKHSVDHIVARQHDGDDSPANLAFCCRRCNLGKGPNLTGVDPLTGVVTLLFHPRRDDWTDHFEWQGAILLGKTAVGRVTAHVLAINLPARVAARRALMDAGVTFPPSP